MSSPPLLLYEEGFSRPPVLPIPLVGKIPYRPLGKSSYKPAPWMQDDEEVPMYEPSKLSEKALSIGVVKCMEVVRLWPEESVQRATLSIINELRSVWTQSPEDLLMSYEEAVDDLDLTKSPGYPYYLHCQNKGEALEQFGVEIADRVAAINRGEDIPCIFALTEKSEILLSEKVKLGKARIFMASDMHHLISSKMLYEKQNQALIDTVGDHPITIGISMPGPQYVRTIVQIADVDNKLNDADLSGCDQRFAPRLARSIRDIRHHFLPNRTRDAGRVLYDAVYCGYGAVLGGVYRIYGNKSGWENTGHDNSLMTWLSLIVASDQVYPGRHWKEVLNPRINGDDVVVHMFPGFEFKPLCDWLLTVGVYLEANVWEARPCTDIVYLSHHLERRHVRGFGDFYVAAGNLPKLMASLNWVKPSQTLQWEESCVAHLMGIRMCLFPWAIEFELVDTILSEYLNKIVITDGIRTLLSARFTEIEMARIHLKLESSFFSRLTNLILSGRDLRGPLKRLVANLDRIKEEDVVLQ